MADTLTNKELESLMEQRGLESLSEHLKFVSFDGTIITSGMSYTYGKDFFIGDYVTVQDKRLGISVDIQIISVTKTISDGVEYLDIGFGYDRLTIRKMKGDRNG